jgi:hypothetical protein
MMSCLCGRHSLKIGGEFRQFLNNNFPLRAAQSIPSVAATPDTANSFSVTLGNQSSSMPESRLFIRTITNGGITPRLTACAD